MGRQHGVEIPHLGEALPCRQRCDQPFALAAKKHRRHRASPLYAVCQVDSVIARTRRRGQSRSARHAPASSGAIKKKLSASPTPRTFKPFLAICWLRCCQGWIDCAKTPRQSLLPHQWRLFENGGHLPPVAAASSSLLALTSIATSTRIVHPTLPGFCPCALRRSHVKRPQHASVTGVFRDQYGLH